VAIVGSEKMEIDFKFGKLIVDPDIYERIVREEAKRPLSKFKKINYLNYLRTSIRCRIDGSYKTYSLARMLLLPPDDKLVDHVNRNPLDNRRCNLRIVNPRQNMLNKIAKNNTGLIGITSRPHRGKTQLRATFRQKSGKRLFFSMYDSPPNRIICAIVHDKFVIQAGDDEYAPLNFPILRNEPYRTKLIQMDVSQFRENSLDSINFKFGLDFSLKNKSS
jgi:hypothetical protein